MRPGPQLAAPEMRHGSRYSVDYCAVAEHCELGQVPLHIRNVSNMGFMVEGAGLIMRGDRLMLRLPTTRRLEGVCIWRRDQQAGFLLERRLGSAEFARVLAAMKAGPTSEAA